MLVVISPAKRLDWSDRDVATTEPAMQDDAVRLVKTARNLTLGKLKALMDLSDDLARLNRDRFQAFADAPGAEVTRPALYAFAGDTYQGLDADTMDAGTVDYAQDRLRILSGLYGLLRPLDAIQPYRLEMGSRLKTRRGQSLYDYWRTDLAKALNAQAEAVGTDTLVNCASQEYFGAVPERALKPRVITPVFMEDKGQGPKIVSFFAKRARGAMARYVLDNRVEDIDGVKSFTGDGYAYQPDLSDAARLVFVRPYPAA
ncbi:MAG: peroxide stress protein YaaA [Pseudomonadota bacterium]